MIRFDTNNYEFNKSSEIGIYIIHGFSNTTYEVKELAHFLGDFILLQIIYLVMEQLQKNVIELNIKCGLNMLRKILQI